MKKTIHTGIALATMLMTFYAYAGEVSPGLSETLQHTHPSEHIAVIVRMADQANWKALTHGSVATDKDFRSRITIRALKAMANNRQKNLIGFLEKEKASGNVLDHTPYWIFNGFSLQATPETIKTLSSRHDVETITEDFLIAPPVSFTITSLQNDSGYTWNIERVRAPEVWEMGYSGSGVVVGIFDTGVDGTHPDLAETFRGGENSWYDPHGEHTTPVDAAGSFSGHGTHVAGIILGENKSGTSIGIAPGATWIAARIWNDAGEEASSTEVHKIFQWFMDPDDDPETDDAPDVVNCSWGFRLFDTFPWCLPAFRDDLKAWRMAGIIPVFSAGNSGPTVFSGESPGNYPETIAVGATDFLDNIAFFSSRGPGNCDFAIFPDLSAPGVAIYSSGLDETYRTLSGTSFAVPHVVGTIALMLNANPNLLIDAMEGILRTTARPLGFVHPNVTYGWGQVDAFEAVCASIP